jgi:hypothetical protein
MLKGEKKQQHCNKRHAKNYQQQHQKRVKEEAREIFHVMGQILLYIFYVAVDISCTHT